MNGPTRPTGYTYRWLRCSSTGTGCTADRRRDQPDLRTGGRRRRARAACVETASNAGGSGQRRRIESDRGRGSSGARDSKVPTVTGTAQQGQTLTEHHGEWSNSPPATPTSGCAAIARGRLPADLERDRRDLLARGRRRGSRLRVSEIASNAGGSGTRGRIGSDRGRGPAGAGGLDRADDHRYSPAGSAADRAPR